MERKKISFLFLFELLKLKEGNKIFELTIQYRWIIFQRSIATIPIFSKRDDIELSAGKIKCYTTCS
jgi:hypothetical protein